MVLGGCAKQPTEPTESTQPTKLTQTRQPTQCYLWLFACLMLRVFEGKPTKCVEKNRKFRSIYMLRSIRGESCGKTGLGVGKCYIGASSAQQIVIGLGVSIYLLNVFNVRNSFEGYQPVLSSPVLTGTRSSPRSVRLQKFRAASLVSSFAAIRRVGLHLDMI